MLKLAFFRDRRFSVALAAECLAVFGLMGALFLSTQFLQFDLGLSPLAAGVRILPIAGMVIVSAALSPVLARRIGTKLTVAAGLGLIARRPVAGLGRLTARDDVRRHPHRPAADRLRRRSHAADGHQLRHRLGPPG